MVLEEISVMTPSYLGVKNGYASLSESQDFRYMRIVALGYCSVKQPVPETLFSMGLPVPSENRRLEEIHGALARPSIRTPSVLCSRNLPGVVEHLRAKMPVLEEMFIEPPLPD